MAGKSKTLYICSECGFESAKWYGKCPGCGQWNTMNEEIREISQKGTATQRILRKEMIRPLRIN